MKEQKGITLIALVVTIVVLLILAAISINIAFGDNGIFKQAQMAAGSTANAIDYESNTLGQQMAEFIENSVGSIGTQNPETTETYYLVDKVQVGDYVAYDAGTWETTVGVPTTNASFGKYTAGQNKGTSVESVHHTTGYKAPTDGWRVLTKSGNGETGTVTLISAGCPAQGMYGHMESDRYEMLPALDNFMSANFININYASSARSATYNDISKLDNNSGGLRNINSSYWLATSAGNSNGAYYIYSVIQNGSFDTTGGNVSLGVRPVITLKAGVKTNATADTEFLGQTCWALK